MTKGDHRGFDNPPRGDYLSGGQAAALLGVKRETLYAYASRGLVRSEPSGRGRARRYLRDDLERLEARRDARSGHGPVAAGALRWGEPVLESALTCIDEGGLRYRGRSAVELAGTSSFEAVAELLWTGELPASRPAWRARGMGVRLASLEALLPADAHPLARLALAVPALAAADAGASTREGEHDRARRLIARMAALLGAGGDLERAREAVREPTVARAALAGFGARPTDATARAVDRVLVLLADHELNVSAFTVRAVASAGSDLYACVSAGLAAIAGPLHGGACDRVEALVAEAATPRGARRVLADRLARGELLPGFGHPLYPRGDPRLAPLMESVASLAPRAPAVRTLIALAEAGRVAGLPPPSVDLGIVGVALALGLPRGAASSLFALGRTAGWVAHALEQRAAGFLLRPRARYVGSKGDPV